MPMRQLWPCDGRRDPDHDCLDVVTGDAAVGCGTGVGQIGSGRCIHRDQRGDPGEHQLAGWESAALEGDGGDVGVCVEDGCPVSHGSPNLLGRALLAHVSVRRVQRRPGQPSSSRAGEHHGRAEHDVVEADVGAIAR